MSSLQPPCHTHSPLANRCCAWQGVAGVGQVTAVTRRCRCQAGGAGAVGAGGAGAAAGGDGRCRPGECHVQGGGWHRAGCPGHGQGWAGPSLTLIPPPRCGRSWSGARGTAWPSTRISLTTRCCWCWRRWIGLPVSSRTSSWWAAERAGRARRVAVSPPLTAVTAQGSEWNAANLEELQQNK